MRLCAGIGICVSLWACLVTGTSVYCQDEMSMYERESLDRAEADRELRGQLEIGIRALKPQYPAGTAVWVEVTWTNRSGRTVVTDASHLKVINFDVSRNGREKIVPYVFDTEIFTERIVIKPNQSYKKRKSINGCNTFPDEPGYRCFHLAPGEYTVSLEHGEALYYSNSADSLTVEVVQ
jgi:hypothetical protein